MSLNLKKVNELEYAGMLFLWFRHLVSLARFVEYPVHVYLIYTLLYVARKALHCIESKEKPWRLWARAERYSALNLLRGWWGLNISPHQKCAP